MKILFITDLYPVKEDETHTPRALHNFVTQWVKQGNEVDVIKPNFILNSFLREKPFYPDGVYNYDGVKIFNVNYFTPFLFDFTKKLPSSCDVNSYDLIIAHMPSGIIFANKLAKIVKKPLICGVHVSDIKVLTNPIYKFYFKTQLQDAYKSSKRIACRSFVLQKKFNELMPDLAEKTFVAASGVDISTASHARFTPHSSPLTIITCANLIKRKNIDKLILAVSELEDFELKIIGDGRELNHLKKIKSKNVKFLGRLPHSKVLEEMEKSDIFILPSVRETFGLVYLEAMACDCITVCSKNDGIDGIIKDKENGFLCEPKINGIKKTLLEIKHFGKIEELLTNSFETVKKYSPEKCAEKYFGD